MVPVLPSKYAKQGDSSRITGVSGNKLLHFDPAQVHCSVDCYFRLATYAVMLHLLGQLPQNEDNPKERYKKMVENWQETSSDIDDYTLLLLPHALI